VGGLTVLQALHRHLPGESTIYLGDLARCPYGTRPQEEVRDFAFQIADLLLREDIKMLVVACNTATAAAYERLREELPVPVIGVITPAVDEAIRHSPTGRIGVVATDGTVASGAYPTAILERLPSATVIQRSASWLVPLVEQGPPARSTVAAGLEPLLADMRAAAVDTLILGCTHFPLVRDIFEVEAGPEIRILDSAETTANQVEFILRDLFLEACGPPIHRILATGPTEAFVQRTQAMFHTCPEIEAIDLLLVP
jgi:glutamate racemase